jgi:GntR family transcriptional repressor for pyruvate dehydrogenase complex
VILRNDSPFSQIAPLRQGARAPTQVLQQIRALIADGVEPGTRLPSELALASMFGVSKNVIREAVKVLVAQGFVTVKHGSGTTVNDRSQWNVFDPEVLLLVRGKTTFQQLTDARRVLEPEIAARAAAMAEETDKARIRAMLRSRRCPIDEHVETDVEFHRRIAEATKNPILVILLDSLGVLLAEGRRVMYGMPGAVEHALEQHRRIYEAIEAGDVARARSRMTDHIDQIAEEFSANTVPPLRSDAGRAISERGQGGDAPTLS